jgi:hypothetical protein
VRVRVVIKCLHIPTGFPSPPPILPMGLLTENVLLGGGGSGGCAAGAAGMNGSK